MKGDKLINILYMVTCISTIISIERYVDVISIMT